MYTYKYIHVCMHVHTHPCLQLLVKPQFKKQSPRCFLDQTPSFFTDPKPFFISSLPLQPPRSRVTFPTPPPTLGLFSFPK